MGILSMWLFFVFFFDLYNNDMVNLLIRIAPMRQFNVYTQHTFSR